MNKLLLLPLLGCALLLPAKVPLEKAVADGVARNEAVLNERLEEENIAVARRSAEFNRWFTADFAGSYLFKSQQMEITLPAMGPTAPRTIEAGGRHNYDLKLVLNQPIFTGGNLQRAVEKEILAAAAAEHVTRLRRVEAAGRIRASFFTWKLLTDRRRSLALLLEQLELHQRKLQSMLQEELVRRSDVLETAVKIEETRIGLIDLDQAAAAEAVQFHRWCSMGPEEIEEPAPCPPLSLEEALGALQARHPLLLSLDERLKMIPLQKKSLSAAYLPQVAGFAELHYGRPGIDFFRNRWSVYLQGGIGVSMPLFRWNRLQRDRRQADIAGEKLQNQRREFLADAEKNLRQLHTQQLALREKLAVIEGLTSLADEDAALKETLYRESQIANIDYLAALTARERYRSMKNEILVQIELVKNNIAVLIGHWEEPQ